MRLVRFLDIEAPLVGVARISIRSGLISPAVTRGLTIPELQTHEVTTLGLAICEVITGVTETGEVMTGVPESGKVTSGVS